MHKFYLRRKLVLLLSAVLLFPTVSVASADGSVCKAAGAVIGFFNGVWNTRDQADNSLFEIKQTSFLSDYSSTALEYELFYNQTISTFGDLAEVFIQRSAEMDGTLANRWEVFWEMLGSGTGESSIAKSAISTIGQVSSGLAGLIEGMYGEIATKTTAGLSKLLGNPPTEEDYRIQQTRIKALALEKKKLVLVAHSQGNLFVNQAYDAALTVTEPERVQVVHVAPASPTLRGEHTLADLDLVINALRVQGVSTVPAITAALPASHLIKDDISGHKFVETYLNDKRDTFKEMRTMMTAALDSLIALPDEVSDDFFTVTLTWDGTGDVDLHVFEPGGEHVYHSMRQGQSGYLDYDNRDAYGPEHYFASCSAAQLQEGDYSIGINNYLYAEGRTALVQVATSARGEIFSKQLDVGEARGTAGSAEPTFVANISVTRDQEGNFQAAMQ